MNDLGIPIIGQLLTSPTLEAIAPAMVEAQGNLAPIKKGGKANYGKYMRLEDILSAVKPVFYANGLVVIQAVTTSPIGIGVTTRILHKSGEWMQATCEFPIDSGGRMTGAQKVGSTITYIKRYGLVAFLGIDSETDNDGNLTPAEQAEQKSFYTYGDGKAVGDTTRERKAFDAYVDANGAAPDTKAGLREWSATNK